MPAFSKKRRASTESDGDVPQKAAKKTKSAGSASAPDGKDGEGNSFWELSKMRRVQLSTFKGSQLISLREYYEKDGNLLPGKKGISLTLAQYKAFVKAIPGINAALRESGAVVDSDEEEGEGVALPEKKPKKETSKSAKANIDATSDEEEED